MASSSDIGFRIECDRVLDALRCVDGPTPGIIAAISRMPVIRVYACLAYLEKEQRAFRGQGDQWWNT